VISASRFVTSDADALNCRREISRIAMVDELEQRAQSRQRFTVGY